MIIYFFGVTTQKSSIHEIFPLWMEILERPEVSLEGYDLKIHDTREAYRGAVALVKYDPQAVGGVVTTHKIDMYEAARDMFEYFDPYTQDCGEISCISKLDGRLEGHAFDPITSGLSLDALIGKDYFARTVGEVLCFGAGGSAVAILLNLLNRTSPGDRPRRFIAVDRSQDRLDRISEMVDDRATEIQVEVVCNEDSQVNDRMMASLAQGSIVINATGMGKDTPGSPVTDASSFPLNGVVWELNYRGELDFLHQARRQAAAQSLIVADGWEYFVRGWAQAVAQVLHVDLTAECFNRLKAAAAMVRLHGSDPIE